MAATVQLREILLVDDDDDVREIARLALTLDGTVRVRSCASGGEAIACYREQRPDLVMLDVMMPGLDGPATLLELRNLDPALAPTIFLTAKTLNSEVDRLLALGARHVISKPFDPMRLLEQVRRWWECALVA